MVNSLFLLFVVGIFFSLFTFLLLVLVRVDP